MNITVILCTHNRCQNLANVLSSVARSRLPESVAWEVLVVDNNSHDRTRDVVADFESGNFLSISVTSVHNMSIRTQRSMPCLDKQRGPEGAYRMISAIK